MYAHYADLCRCSFARLVLPLTLATLGGPFGSVIYCSCRPYPVSNSFVTTLGVAALQFEILNTFPTTQITLGTQR
jgi:hypothetical protein